MPTFILDAIRSVDPIVVRCADGPERCELFIVYTATRSAAAWPSDNERLSNDKTFHYVGSALEEDLQARDDSPQCD
jgi:hypothetical protein